MQNAQKTVPQGFLAHPPHRSRQLRLETLIRLRWLAIAGQTVAILIVYVGLGFAFEASLALALVATSAWLNILLRIRFSANYRLGEKWATALLGYDALQLAGLLSLSGGLQNPFAILMIGPAVVGATTLGPRATLALGGLIAALATIIAVFHLPLPWYVGETIEIPAIYIMGQWTALILSLMFMTFYAFRVAKEGRQLADALAASEFVLQREQHLYALDGLAAAAAHELGTPLSTIAVVSKELSRAVPADSPLAEDADLIRSQAERCRQILAKLRSLSADPQSHFGPCPLSHIVTEAIEPHRESEGIEIRMQLSGTDDEPIVPRNPGILYGLGNFIENAVDFATRCVDVTLYWNDESVGIIIEDDGPGFTPEALQHVGEPYHSHRKPGGYRRTKVGGGLGLGVFIARTLLERSGANVLIGNRSTEPGAHIEIRWSRSQIEDQLKELSEDHWQLQNRKATASDKAPA